MTMFDQPAEEPANGDQVAVDRRHGLTAVPSKMVSEVGDVPGRDPTDREPFTVGRGEPLGELLDVLGERSSGMIRQIVGGEEVPKQGRFVRRQRCRRKHYHHNSSRFNLHNWTQFDAVDP